MMATSDQPGAAWGDESIRISAPTPTYLMAATILREGADTSRLEAIKPKGAAKLHWRELTDRLRRESLEAVAGLEGLTVMVACSPLPKKKQERGRRRCMELLLPELEALGVGLVTLESRVLQMDRKDIDMLQALKSKGAVPDMRYEPRTCERRAPTMGGGPGSRRVRRLALRRRCAAQVGQCMGGNPRQAHSSGDEVLETSRGPGPAIPRALPTPTS